MSNSLSLSDARWQLALVVILCVAAGGAVALDLGAVYALPLLAFAAVLGGLAGMGVAASLGRVQRATAVLRAAAAGDLERRIVELPERGPVGDLQRAANQALDIIDAFVREAGGAMGAAAAGRFHRKVLLRGLPGAFQGSARIINEAGRLMEEKTTRFLGFADGFERDVGGVVSAVSNAAEGLNASAHQLSSAAAAGATRAGAAARATGDVTQNTQTVAAATEELTASVSEISRQVTEAARTARHAVTEAGRADETVGALAERARRIGDVVQMIAAIAAQTNLLALNATIEAARAGDAGKGFAVVAAEVKQLAQQTGKATDEIGQQIGEIQLATEGAVAAIRAIGHTIQRVDGAAAAISAAVEEQGAATREIARSVGSAADGARAASEDITGVREAAEGTGLAAAQVLQAAGDLSRQSALLTGKVGAFLASARAG